ncbi:MAG: nucleoside deaminase [Clostridia bacterium]|nr:nucleoside deaminase [Clostridia bacterium]
MAVNEEFMRMALALAEQAAAEGEVPVGAVVVKDGAVVGRGRNRRELDKNALAHAEIEAIDEACRTLGGWRLSGCDLYVTLEPCPMCAGGIINARIDNVYYGADDPKAGSCGSLVSLFDLPYNHKPTCTGGVLGEQASEQLKRFFGELREKRKIRERKDETDEETDL